MGHEEVKREGFDFYSLACSMESIYIPHMEGEESKNVEQYC